MIAVHVRRGDYLHLPQVFHTLDVDYYEEARKHFPNCDFVAFSDDPKWVKKNLPWVDVIEGNPPIVDMALMASCEGVIMANSSFSWWGAYLNKRSNLFIAPKYWLLHKDNSGIWFPADAITSKFTYIDIHGKVCSSEECVREFDSSINYTNKKWSF